MRRLAGLLALAGVVACDKPSGDATQAHASAAV